MNAIRHNIRSTSTAVYVFLLVFAALLCLVTAASAVGLVTAAQQGEAAGIVLLAKQLLRRALAVALLGKAAWVFRLIAHSDTPFLPRVGGSVKLIGVLMAAAMVLPHWLGQLLKYLLGGPLEIWILDEGGMLGIVLAAMLYCLGIIFDYGCQLQRERTKPCKRRHHGDHT